MTKLFIIRGSRQSGFYENIDSTILTPVEDQKVGRVVGIIERSGQTASKTYEYILRHRYDLYAWANKKKGLSGTGFKQHIESGTGSMVCFALKESKEVVAKGIISMINDISADSVNKDISSELWTDNAWVNIWFIEKVVLLRGVYKDQLERILRQKLHKPPFSNNQNNTLSWIDDTNASEQQMQAIIRCLGGMPTIGTESTETNGC